MKNEAPRTPPVPGYDPDGNATAYPVPAAPAQNATLAWDGENRLLATTVAGTATTYQYDALSRRIAQTTGASREVTIYDGWNCLAEYEGAACTLHATNLWGPDLSGTPQGAGGVGGLLAVQKHTGLAIGLNYPLYDGNGNITEYLNAAGAVVAHYQYDSFGRIYASSGTLKDAFPYRFSTKRLDAATGLYYYGYRYYDPVTGRWLSGDPIEEAGGVHLYGFVKNIPISNIDKDGRFWFVVLIGMAIMANPNTANAPAPGDPMVQGAGPVGMVVDIAGGQLIGAAVGFTFRIVVTCVQGKFAAMVIAKAMGTSIPAVSGQASNLTGIVTRESLEVAAASTGTRVKLFTRQTGPLDPTRKLSTSVGEVSLANKAGADRILYEAEVPQELLEQLFQAGLTRESQTLMGVVEPVFGKEIQFSPKALEFVFKFFRVSEQTVK